MTTRTEEEMEALAAELLEIDLKDEYYLQDSRSFNGNYMMFWAKDSKGYTSDIRKAHVFTKEQASKLNKNRDTDIPRDCQEVQNLARHCVDFQDFSRSDK
ncbi:hypothetical protein ACTXKB_03345 [Psychrobacter aquimaris]|uniref:hypothetical protein n=1 Tax=Psychrobacter aquimaris TaxID=292733 RepID=UPI003FD5F5BA